MRVTRSGVHLVRADDRPLVVDLDGRYVWSFTATRDGRPSRTGVLVPWPPALVPHLDGVATVRIADPSGTEVAYEGEVRFGDGPGRVRVEDRHGHPLAVDKVGHLARAFAEVDDQVRDEILAGTRRALDDLREHAGVDAYLCYGALLGAVRDGAMIAHDSDTDVCYQSRHEDPVDVVLESFRVERVLRSRGWRALRMSGGDVKLLLPLSDGRTCHVDVFAAFRVGATFYQLGNRSGSLPPDAVLPTSAVELHGVTFPAPADPEAMLAFLYGPGWRTPDPSFAYADPPAGVRRLDGWLRGFRDRAPEWSEVNRRTRGRGRTPFARWVHAQLPAGERVLDVGCGVGRDAVWYAGRGRPVRAVDLTPTAGARLRRRAGREGVDVPFRLLALGDLRGVLALGTELARQPHHVHARGLVEALDPGERANLWRLCRMAGGTTFLETAAAGVPEEIAARGGRVEHEETDPTGVRLRVTWPRRAA